MRSFRGTRNVCVCVVVLFQVSKASAENSTAIDGGRMRVALQFLNAKCKRARVCGMRACFFIYIFSLLSVCFAYAHHVYGALWVCIYLTRRWFLVSHHCAMLESPGFCVGWRDVYKRCTTTTTTATITRYNAINGRFPKCVMGILHSSCFVRIAC